ncbi:hypothetical protein HRR83_003426 [Exophiala dermatitidis]|uniref:Uncharacterized protein n=2 Tax=Exophiala dermatitidis TaxID=5970 RepID=H6BM74_EXODN|nr:uncharacterized protein HMPREF1120_00233 [Exophiala dermatitidis NIH/UT8656]KAJ4514679.1 hypothetical protein HRR75_004043 [Exophiala dermatitidis]EHY52010.1 hypothetical protein HMPREF1120_00233 [Exophiala dermatitidis NIH/UT8656]KAJ4518119.1 hypothetical protein HRR74_004414 [Exophiala dermatitidis]KAJ4521017.1 hypothetical protein HRR73_003358 [Exophiala dermatitidis]KAJ4545970.1 hypothetical protein HRR78_005809 [Exophiala dermatitidis]
MRFGRRKSSAAAGECGINEYDARRRNRLSKPLTKTISTSISATSLQEPVAQCKNASKREPPPGGPLSSHPSNPALRRHIRSEIFDEETPSLVQSSKSDSTAGVVHTDSQPDSNIARSKGPAEQEQPPSSPKEPRKRKSFVLRAVSTRRSTSLGRRASYHQSLLQNGDTASGSTPTSSLDRVVDSPAIPPSRRASFTPGTATRKASTTLAKQEIPEQRTAEDSEDVNIVDTDDVDWQPPPPRMAGRAETPADLDYSHLGSLRLGSLQIVNGRASPAFSEMSKLSKQILAVPQPQRDVSSEYGEAEEDLGQVDMSNGKRPSRANPSERSEQRVFSWEGNDDNTCAGRPIKDVVTILNEDKLIKDDGRASLMAQEYIAELPASPFSAFKSGSLSGSLRRSASEQSLHDSSFSSLQKSPVLERFPGNSSPTSFESRSPSPTGSVICRSRMNPGSERILRAFGPNDVDVDDHTLEDMMSWYSPFVSGISPGDTSQSILEPQAQPCQGYTASSATLHPPHPIQKSDSGYSSTNSLRSLSTAKPPSPVRGPPTHGVSPVSDRRSPQPGDRSYLAEARPPLLKSRQTEPSVPTSAPLRPAAVSANTTPAIPTSDTASVKPDKVRKKLQKKRRQSQPSISISRVHSFEADAIPRVPSDAEENLRIRSKEVPELEKTYISYGDMGLHDSVSSMDLRNIEVRFPSPAPDQSSQVRRPRSRSRPRSWMPRPISRSKLDERSSRRNSSLDQTETMMLVKEFGAAYSMYGGPYDLVHENIVYGHSMGHNTGVSALPRPRPMMDDKTAAEFARRRSRSIQERESILADRRSGFNDRGGIPGKNLRPASFANDAPPITPEMLQKAYRTSSEQRQASIGGGFSPEPPPPPPHSPRPAYVDYEEDYANFAVAPPPPSHSPRPMDIMPDPWATQSAYWASHTQSSAELCQSQGWESQTYEEYRLAVEDEPLYPEIPPRSQEWERSPAPAQHYFSSEPQGYNGFDGNGHVDGQDYSYFEYPYEYPAHNGSRYDRDSQQVLALQEIPQPRGRAVRPYAPGANRPLPLPRASGMVSPRPHSRAGSAHSFASSLAEELHPDNLERPCPPPEFGRYSGGMGWEYEHGKGFGGSVGTRSVSGRAEAMRKSVAMRASFGVDLSDVPVMMAVVRG